MTDKATVLDNIFVYGIYSLSVTYDEGNEVDKIKSAMKFLGVNGMSTKVILDKGEILTDSLPTNSPKVGLNTSIYFDYYNNPKTDFQKVCLLGFLALKSIIQNDAYKKITNNYWLARMDGQVKAVNHYDDLSEPLHTYTNNYQLRKIKTALENDWYLITYPGRGFYVSFKMTLEDLTYQVMKRNKKFKERALKKKKKKP